MAPESREPFVGRRTELEQLADGLREAQSGRGRLYLMCGEPGIGKTRLADEATQAALRTGVEVVWGRCWESGGAPAYWPWLDALSQLARGLDDETLRQVVGDGAAVLGDLLPEVGARLQASGAVVPPNPDEARFRLWRTVATFVRGATQKHGAVLVIDDLHAADRESLLLLHFLARQLRSMRVLLIGTYRDVEARMDAEASALLTQIGREGVTLSLRGLGREAVGDFFRRRVGGSNSPISEPVQETLFESTQGNPLFLGEMARLLDDQGPEALVSGAMPEGVRAVIRQRLRAIRQSDRPLLALAAVEGDEPDAALLALAADRSAEDIRQILFEAERTGVLVMRAGRRRFSHALVREVLYRDLDDETRRILHGRIAQALAKQHEHNPIPPLAKLAYHGLQGPSEGLARAVDFAERAATSALDLAAYDEAVGILGRAQAALATFPGHERLRARVILAMAEARIRRGEGETGKALCRQAAGIARGLDDAGLRARAALVYGKVYAFVIVDPILVDLLQEALLALPPGDSSLRAALLARLGAALQPALRTEEPVLVAREAMASARRIGDRRTLLETVFTGLSAMMDVTDARERQRLNLEVEQLATALGDRERLLMTHARLVVDHMEQGDLALADCRIDAFERLAEDLKAPWYAWRVPAFRAMRAQLHGLFSEAETLAAQAGRMAKAAGDAQAERSLLVHRESFLRASERHEELVAHDPIVRRERAAFSMGTIWQEIGSALTFCRVEDRERTRQHLDLVHSQLTGPGTFDNVFGLFFFSEAIAFAGTEPRAQVCYDLLRPWAHRDVVFGLSSMAWEGPVTRLLALLAARLGQWDEAWGYFEASLVRIKRLDARPYLARCHYEYARTRVDRGQAGDFDKAAGLLATAGALATELGQSGLLRLIDIQRSRIGVDAPTRAPAPSVGAVAAVPVLTMIDEGEYWAIAAFNTTFRLKNSLGLRYLSRLVATPNQEIHVMDLVGGGAGADEAAADGGDAGELLDTEARDSYRAKLVDLRETLAEAESFGDAGRASRAREEIEFLAAELSRAVGLGGRARRAGSAAERARTAVQRRIKNAIGRIAEHDPDLARVLSASVRTGNFCEYRTRT